MLQNAASPAQRCSPNSAPQMLLVLSPHCSPKAFRAVPLPSSPCCRGTKPLGLHPPGTHRVPRPQPCHRFPLERGTAPRAPQAHTHTLPLQHPTGSTTAISHVPRSSVYTHKCRGIVCKAALIPAAGTGPNIDEPNLLPLAVQDAGLCCCRQTIPGLWQPAPIFSVLLEQGQL